jgi:oligopeptidase B
MLMGAVANLRPELWRCVVAEVPFVDVLNTMQDETLPLTPIEWPEWGNPLTSKEDFLRIRSWCPYENIEAKAYPAMLVTAGISDPRVTYWEPAKYVAKLRAMKTDDNLCSQDQHGRRPLRRLGPLRRAEGARRGPGETAS